MWPLKTEHEQASSYLFFSRAIRAKAKFCQHFHIGWDHSIPLTMAVWACVVILCLFLSSFTKGYKTTTWKSNVLHIRKNVTCTGIILKISFLKVALSNILCLKHFWQYRQTEWLQILARFLGWILNCVLIDVVAVEAQTAFETWVASACLHIWPSVCSVA